MMSIEQRKIECEQYIDSEEPRTITFVPSDSKSNGKDHFLVVTEDPFDFDVWIMNREECEVLKQKELQRSNNGN